MAVKIEHGSIAWHQLRAEKLEGFVRMVAGLKKDGEGLDGEPYEQAIDDAFDTLASLISLARAILEDQK